MKVAVDASALVAIALNEPGWEVYDVALQSADEAWATPVNLFEASLVLVLRHARLSTEEFAAWVEHLRIQTSHAVDHMDALDAYFRYGKGVHRAGLNMGDCFAYALAKKLDAPLLYKGDDFSRTDIRSALQPT